MKKKLIIILTLVVVLALVGIFIYLIKSGKIKPFAAGEVAALALDPSSGSYEIDANFDVNIILNTGGEAVDDVDIFHLHYDPFVLEVIDADGNQSGVQIQKGSIFSTYTGNSVNTANGEISISGLDLGGQGYNGTGIFATINFRPIASADPTNVTFDFTLGSGIDCNVVQHGTALDILASVTNGQYTIGGRAIDKPSAPSNLTAQPSTDRITLNWGASTPGINPIAGYAIYRCETSGCGPTSALDTTDASTLTYTDTQASGGITYFYTVRAFDNQALPLYSDPSNEASAQLQSQVAPPSAPTSLSASAGADRISLNWTASTQGTYPIAGYAVYRGESAGNESTSPIGNPTGTSFEDTNVDAGITYYYVVKAYDDQTPANYSEASSEVNALIPVPVTSPSAPTNLSASADTEKNILTWTASTQGTNPIAGYKIYRGGVSSGELLYGSSTDTTFVDTRAERGITYYYFVRAYDNQTVANYSVASNEISIRLRDVPPAGDTGRAETPSSDDDHIEEVAEAVPETPGVGAEAAQPTEKEKAAPPAQTISKLPTNLQPQAEPAKESAEFYKGKTIQTWALWFLYAIIPALLAGGAIYLYLRKKKKDRNDGAI